MLKNIQMTSSIMNRKHNLSILGLNHVPVSLYNGYGQLQDKAYKEAEMQESRSKGQYPNKPCYTR